VRVGELFEKHKFDEATNEILYPETPGEHKLA